MTTPSKINHRPALPGEFVLQEGKTKAQSLGLQHESQINYDALNHAITEVQRLFDFWKLLQGAHVDLQNINGHWNVFKAMRSWPK